MFTYVLFISLQVSRFTTCFDTEGHGEYVSTLLIETYETHISINLGVHFHTV